MHKNSKKNFLSARTLAAKIIAAVLTEHRSLTAALYDSDANHLSAADRGFMQELCYGTLRWFWQIKVFAESLLKQKMAAKDQDIFALILLGIYQLRYLQTAPHAALHSTVEAARELKKTWACNLINAVLRNFLRQEKIIEKKICQMSSAQFAHPLWFCAMLKKHWPAGWEKILEANNSYPSLTLRVNRLQNSRLNYLEKLQSAGIAAAVNPLAPDAITLQKACDVNKLPGFHDGECSVQDASAQLAALLLMLEPGQTVLDACAAPGGKTAHILEIEPALKKLIALDNNNERLLKVTENLTRLKLSAEIVCADAVSTEHWWDGQLFDRILLDAPCSATGVIRRHPDIKILRQAEDIPTLAEQQKTLLNALWKTLKSGGILLYATCSVLPAENVAVMQEFFARHADAQELFIDAEWGVACSIGRQVLPEVHGNDGFYFARVLKK